MTTALSFTIKFLHSRSHIPKRDRVAHGIEECMVLDLQHLQRKRKLCRAHVHRFAPGVQHTNVKSAQIARVLKHDLLDVLARVVIEDHIVLGLAQHDLRQRGEIILLGCLCHTIEIIDLQEYIAITGEVGTLVGDEHVGRCTPWCQRG